MSKYLLTSPHLKGSMLLMYNEEGNLVRWEIDAELNEKQRFWLATHAPLTENLLESVVQNTKFEKKEVDWPLDFDTFWNVYNYKVGDKKKAEKLWNALKDSEKVAALNAIPAYHYYLACRTNMEQTHATTWLNQRRWENEYKR